MATNVPKSLDELAKEVADSGMGVSVEDLKVLFEDTPAAAVAPTNVEPAVQPAAPAPVAEPPVQDASIAPDVLPEQFRDKDMTTSIKRMTQSYQELEAALRKEKEDRHKLEQYLQAIPTQPAPVQQQPTHQVEQLPDITDEAVFEKPVDSVTKISQREAAKVALTAIAQYHEYNNRQRAVEAFKTQNQDFDQYREDMLAILKSRPDLDQNPNSLPLVYDLAKKRSVMRIEAMKNQLGLPQQTTQPQMSSDEIVEKAKQSILEEIRKRKAASGMTGSTTPVSPQDRMAPVSKGHVKTPEEELWESIQGAGPSVPAWEK